MSKNNYVLISGSANEALAAKVAAHLQKHLGKIEIATFSDSEKRVRIEENIGGKTAFVIASLSNPVDSHLVELCLIGDALKANDVGKMVAVIPYYGYARQDKAHRSGEGVSARVMARLIEAVNFDKVITVDLHSELVSGFFDIPVVHLSSAQLFVDVLAQDKDNFVVVAPDAGAVKRSQHFADLLDASLSMIEKKRNLDRMHEIEKVRFIGDVGGKTAILFDDVVTSGSTLVKAAYALKDQGAKKVIACVTHADFVDGTRQVLSESPIDRVIVSDSIAIKPEYIFPKLEVISLAGLLADTIKK